MTSSSHFCYYSNLGPNRYKLTHKARLSMTTLNRRSFIKASLLTGGGLCLHFNGLAGALTKAIPQVLTEADYALTHYIKVNTNGTITLFNPNPEFGQNVKTTLPMILGEELDVDWAKIVVEQANFYPERYGRQFTGGSQSVRQAWIPLRTAGATARQMLMEAAALEWKVPIKEITTNLGTLHHKASNRSTSYAQIASKAATLPIPTNVQLKDKVDFKIVGSSKKNIDSASIITGKPLFGIDYKVDGMLYAMIIHPPAFGLRLKSFNDKEAKTMPGIHSIFKIEPMTDAIVQNFFDTTSFTEFVAIVGRSTWEVLQAKKKIEVEWEVAPERHFKMASPSGTMDMRYPAGLESTQAHYTQMDLASKKQGSIARKDGEPEKKFAEAAHLLERTYTAPFLAHNTMEPVNCFAHVTDDSALLYGPTQAPEFIIGTLAQRLNLPKEKIQIQLPRMGGGFGLRAYSHHLLEAAVISKQIKAPVKLLYTREDEMTAGIYRPMYSATFRAAIDHNNNLLAFHVKAGGIPETPLHANRFPAGAIEHYLAESWHIPSNITIGAFRAPRSNFMAAAEQSFLDELAATLKKDPIAFRLELLERAQNNPVGKNNDYDPVRYADVLKLVQEKSNWESTPKGVHRGVSAYFCHNSYAAEVIDISVKDGLPQVDKVVAAIDCGIVVNKDAAINMAEGAIIDAIGNALYGELPFKDGKPLKSNFNDYRMIRMSEAPKAISIHFVENQHAPTGMGEPPFPPAFAAVANALFKATGKRFYHQPFSKELTK